MCNALFNVQCIQYGKVVFGSVLCRVALILPSSLLTSPARPIVFPSPDNTGTPSHHPARPPPPEGGEGSYKPGFDDPSNVAQRF